MRLVGSESASINTSREPGQAGSGPAPDWYCHAYLRLVTDLKLLFVGPDQKMVTKRPYNWSPGLILTAFCTILQARPVGTGLGAKFGRKPAKNQIKIIICITYSKRR